MNSSQSNGGMSMKNYEPIVVTVIVFEQTDIVRTSGFDNFTGPGVDWGE
jgi:hypothetical protein